MCVCVRGINRAEAFVFLNSQARALIYLCKCNLTFDQIHLKTFSLPVT